MDTLNHYQNVIKSILTECVAYLGRQEELSFYTVFDDNANQYLLIMSGWDGNRRMYNALIHLSIIADKIWIQNNDTEFTLWEDFERFNIPKSEVIIGFLPQSKQQLQEA
jgi:XisI protein